MKTFVITFVLFLSIIVLLNSCGGEKDESSTFLNSTTNEATRSNDNPANEVINEPSKANDIDVNDGEKETKTIKNNEFHDGVYNFVIFDKEYGKSTAKCNVFVDGNNVKVVVTDPILDDIYVPNQTAYKGRLKKIGKLWYIIENNNSMSPSDDDFEFSTPRIDFKRKLVIHY